MGNIVATDLDELTLDRALTNPIHDSNGVLLLAAGCIFDASVKASVQRRGISRILVSEEDMPGATAQEPQEALAVLGKKLDERVDAMIRDGRLSLRNTGPPAREQVVQHGRANYDVEAGGNAAKRQGIAREEMNRMMDAAASGREINGGTVASLANGFTQSLMADVAGTVHQAISGPADEESSQHSVTLATLAMSIGIDLGMDEENLRILGIAAMLQDIGTCRIPPDILKSPRKLNAIEFLEIEKQVLYTADILESMTNIPEVVQLIAYQSHERIDGSGYPRGRTKQSIHFHARVLHVADTYVALTSPRPHRKPLMPYCAMECILQLVRRQRLDAGIVQALIHSVSLFPIGSFVVLSDRSVARVLRSNGSDFTQPIVIRLLDHLGNPTDIEADDEVIDLRDSDLTIVQAIPRFGDNEIAVRFNESGSTGDPAKVALVDCLLKSGRERTIDADDVTGCQFDRTHVNPPIAPVAL